MLARACFEEGLYPQSFSIFGGERRGAAVGAFVRLDHEKIYLKCDIDRPDHLILFDGTLLKEEEVIEQIKDGGVLLLNRERKIPANGLQGYTIGTINAFEISKRHGLGAIMNTAINETLSRTVMTGAMHLRQNRRRDDDDESFPSQPMQGCTSLATAIRDREYASSVENEASPPGQILYRGHSISSMRR